MMLRGICFWTRRRTARAFSLVELLVVMALTMMILGILAMAYDGASRAMRLSQGLRQIGTDLNDVERQLRGLLRQRHFEGDLKVSEINNNDPDRQPQEGFFAVSEGAPPAGEIDWDDVLNFTVRLVGNEPGAFFETSLTPPSGWQPPPSLSVVNSPNLTTSLGQAGFPESRYQTAGYRSQWAEIVVFLSRQPDPGAPNGRAATVSLDHPAHPDPPNNGPAARLYRLHLRKLLLAPSHFAKGAGDFDLTGRILVHEFRPPQTPPLSYYPEAYDLSLRRELPPPPPGMPPSEQWVLNTPRDVRNPANRFFSPGNYGAPRPWDPSSLSNDWPSGCPGPLSSLSGRQGSDIVLNNVVSFDVKLIRGGGILDGSYDSTSNQPLLGIWIRIRIFNPKTQQMRDCVILEAL